MAKWEIIEDNKFKKEKGGKTTATRAVSAKRAAVKAAATPNNLTIITPEQKEKAQADYDEAYKWTSDYMKSPMYKKMLTESSANTREFDNIDKTRWSNFKSIPPLQILPQPRNEPNTGGTSLGFNGQVQLFPYGFGAKAIYSHELSHSTDRPVEESDSRIIPQSDKNYISQHVPTTFEDSPMYATNKSFYDLFKKNKPKEYKKEAKDYKKFHINYVGQDTETRARLNAIRQGAQQNNLYDPFKEGVTPELYYDKLKNFKFEKEDKSGADPMYQLKNVYSDEEIIYMLNHISENKKENDGTELDNLPKAKNGLVIEDPRGQWAHPGSVTRIPSNQITMQGVNYPVLGVSDKGHTQMMYPGEDYSFRGKLVTEYPMMQSGGQTSLRNQILNTRLPATNRPTLNLNFNRSTSTTSPLSLQALGEQDYGVSLNKNGLNLSAGLNLGRFSGGLNYGYNQEGDKAHNFGANANLGLGKNLNLSADTNFDSNKNYQVNASLKYNFQDGGEVNFTYAGENHRVYKKESPTGNGKGIKGHIMVNHPTENKGKWDTIDLTKITNGKVKTVAQGVASTKKWHDENPKYADGGMIKRADGSYSKRGLWDNIRDNAGSGKKPTKEMLKQERKIKSQYANGGQVSSWEIIEDTPKFPNGGATNPPIYVNDPKDPRIRMYNDSLSVYSKGENDYKDYLNTNRRLHIPNTSTRIEHDPIVYDGSKPARMQPIESHRYYYNHSPDVIAGTSIPSLAVRAWTDRYKKPVQPYIFDSTTTSKLIPDKSKGYSGVMNLISKKDGSILNTDYINYKRQQEETIPFNKMGLDNLDPLQSMQKVPEPNPITSVPKDYVTIKTGSSYRNPETGAFEQKTFKIDRVTGKKISEETFKNGGKTKKSNWEIIENSDELDKYKNGGKTPAWQRKEGKSPTGGLNAKGRASLKKEGHDIKPPQPQGGSRKKSFCARMTGLKKKLTGSKKANDPNSRVNLSLKKWKC